MQRPALSDDGGLCLYPSAGERLLWAAMRLDAANFVRVEKPLRLGFWSRIERSFEKQGLLLWPGDPARGAVSQWNDQHLASRRQPSRKLRKEDRMDTNEQGPNAPASAREFPNAFAGIGGGPADRARFDEAFASLADQCSSEFGDEFESRLDEGPGLSWPARAALIWVAFTAVRLLAVPIRRIDFRPVDDAVRRSMSYG